MSNRYDVGDRVVLSTSTPFQDASGVAFDPDVVRFKVKPPSGETVVFVYGEATNVVKVATGDYTCTIDVDEVGDWSYRVEGETSGQENRGADEKYFAVNKTAF